MHKPRVLDKTCRGVQFLTPCAALSASTAHVDPDTSVSEGPGSRNGGTAQDNKKQHVSQDAQRTQLAREQTAACIDCCIPRKSLARGSPALERMHRTCKAEQPFATAYISCEATQTNCAIPPDACIAWKGCPRPAITACISYWWSKIGAAILDACRAQR